MWLTGGKYPGSIRASVSGHPGTKLYPGRRILSLSGHPGKPTPVIKTYPWVLSRAHQRGPNKLHERAQPIRAGSSARAYPGIRANETIRASHKHNREGRRSQLCYSILSWGQLLSGHPGRKLYPGIRATTSIRVSGQNNLSGQPGKKVYPGSRAETCIRASPTGYAGRNSYPGIRAETSIRASGQKNLSGHPGKRTYPGIQAKSMLKCNIIHHA